MKKDYNIPAIEVVAFASGMLMDTVSPAIPDPNGNGGANSGTPIP